MKHIGCRPLSSGAQPGTDPRDNHLISQEEMHRRCRSPQFHIVGSICLNSEEFPSRNPQPFTRRVNKKSRQNDTCRSVDRFVSSFYGLQSSQPRSHALLGLIAGFRQASQRAITPPRVLGAQLATGKTTANGECRSGAEFAATFRRPPCQCD